MNDDMPPKRHKYSRRCRLAIIAIATLASWTPVAAIAAYVVI